MDNSGRSERLYTSRYIHSQVFWLYNFRVHWANFCNLPYWKRRRKLATLYVNCDVAWRNNCIPNCSTATWSINSAAEAFNRPRRRFFQPEDDPFDFPLGNKDPMYIHACCCQEGFWEICWLSNGHENPYQPANMRLLFCEGCSTNRTWLRPSFSFSERSKFDRSRTWMMARCPWTTLMRTVLEVGTKGYSMCIN